MSAPDKILELVALFGRNADAYRGGHYNEAQLRQEFINPFCTCLGWDMDNEQGYAEMVECRRSDGYTFMQFDRCQCAEAGS